MSRTILTILPALVPTLEARPALANWAAEDAPAAPELLNNDYVIQPVFIIKMFSVFEGTPLYLYHNL